MTGKNHNLYIILISVHGLIRSKNLELGRDADTGGQTKYVLEMATELGRHPKVGRVDLITQRVTGNQLDPIYGSKSECISDSVQIVRLDAGDTEYVPKETLWDRLDNFTDHLISYINEQATRPDLIHGHYADAGYVAKQISQLLNVPLVFTGHSLGRVKRQRLLASGLKQDDIEQRYNISRRIDAEEETLGVADLVITSTHQEIEEQYGLYDFYQPQRMTVVPPGTDLTQFHPPNGTEKEQAIYHELRRFLNQPDRPVILALSRPDRRKNLHTLIEAYGESETLQQLANLVIIAGNRDDITELEDGARDVLTQILITIDSYDLYDKVAYPKRHQPQDVSVLYRIATVLGGVFVNPALTEPFGLTLIEAAACGLPIVATEDGGPKDIINNCSNGVLIDPLDKQQIADAITDILTCRRSWEQYSQNGIEGVQRHYSWRAHVETYMDKIVPLVQEYTRVTPVNLPRRASMYHDRAIFSDLDQNLAQIPHELEKFVGVIRDNRKRSSFGIATGRRLDSALKKMKRLNIPQPDVLITSLGTEIYYAPNLTKHTAWEEHIDHLWKPGIVRRLLADTPGIELQEKLEQSPYKISYFYDPDKAPAVEEITSLLYQNDQTVTVQVSFGQFLDIVPVRAAKGKALRWIANQWNIPIEKILVAGGSGADEDMMRGNTLAVVVANRHDEELSDLIDLERVYFAQNAGAAGILEAIEYYDFFNKCQVPAG